jgi:hypothetical protein
VTRSDRGSRFRRPQADRIPCLAFSSNRRPTRSRLRRTGTRPVGRSTGPSHLLGSSRRWRGRGGALISGRAAGGRVRRIRSRRTIERSGEIGRPARCFCLAGGSGRAELAGMGGGSSARRYLCRRAGYRLGGPSSRVTAFRLARFRGRPCFQPISTARRAPASDVR